MLNQKKIAFTICSLNYMHMAITLKNSFLSHNPNWEFYIIIMDMISNSDLIDIFSNINSLGFNFIFPYKIKEKIPYLPLEEILIRYNVIEANTAIKPFVFDYFFNEKYDKVVYFDPDIFLYNNIDEIDNLLNTYNIILTPHTLMPYPEDGKHQNSQIIFSAGIYNCGFIAMSFSNSVINVINFWESQLKTKSYNRPWEYLMTDQIWANWFPLLCENCYILRKPIYNAAYWNLHERSITNIDGKWYSNNEPLVFYHFSGLPLNNINLISKYQNRYTLNNRKPDLKILFEEYCKSIKSNYFDIFSKQKYFFNKLPNMDFDLNFERRLNMISKFYITNINPFAADGNKKIKYTKMAFSRFRFLKFPKNPFQFTSAIFSSKKPNFGINYIGYFDESHSIGGTGRLLIKKSYSSGIPFSIFKISSGSKKISQEEIAEFDLYSVQEPVYPINIFIINADQISTVYNDHKNIFFNKINYARWAWEFETGFQKYADSYKYLDGAFVYSKYEEKSMKKYLPPNFPVYTCLHPFIFNTNNLIQKNIIRSIYNIPTNHFIVFFNFDYNSSYDRKNPEAILRVFATTFKYTKDTILIIKSTNMNNYQDKASQFKSLIDKFNLSSRVYIIDKFISKIEMLSLINSSDVYISLHRAEGFGVGLLEAMSLGIPTIATNYSGNLDFMTHDNSILIDAKLVPMKTDFPPYVDVESWAEPDESLASYFLHKLYDDPEFAFSIGEKGKNSVTERFSERNYLNSFYKFINSIIN